MLINFIFVVDILLLPCFLYLGYLGYFFEEHKLGEVWNIVFIHLPHINDQEQVYCIAFVNIGLYVCWWEVMCMRKQPLCIW